MLSEFDFAIPLACGGYPNITWIGPQVFSAPNNLLVQYLLPNTAGSCCEIITGRREEHNLHSTESWDPFTREIHPTHFRIIRWIKNYFRAILFRLSQFIISTYHAFIACVPFIRIVNILAIMLGKPDSGLYMQVSHVSLRSHNCYLWGYCWETV